ncbi:MAG: OmpA family protein [Holophagales bacterium]|nr:OmpA family protein [Holophagales bacterium]MBK9965278.1 OmpA family protein [Holophagales bacterium]
MIRSLSPTAVLLALAASPLAAAPPARPAPAVAAGVSARSLVSLSAGALVVKKPQEYSDSWSAFWLLDERPQSGWAAPQGLTTAQTIVIALPEETVLDAVEFDTASADCDGCAAKGILVEVSATGATGGFARVADVVLKDKADRQRFPVSAAVPGRWVRLTVKGNQGSSEYVELMDFRATGRHLTKTPLNGISGTYETNYGLFHVRQEGTSVSGCYEHSDGLLDGGIDGHVLSFTWREGERKGPAYMAFTPDGREMLGLWWVDGQTGEVGGVWSGTKKSSEVGSCPHWSGGARQQLEKDLEAFGRARIYGINFDPDSDRIRDESKPTLDRIAALLKAKAGWKLAIEGHTDSTSTAQHNQELSERRAASVRAYLVTSGVDAARLASKGLGASKPAASNATEMGRAQNRRVELVKL